MLDAQTAQQKPANKEDFLSALPKARELKTTIEDAESEFDGLDQFQAKMKEGSKQSESSVYGKKKAEYRWKNETVRSLYQPLRERYDAATRTYPKARLQKYTDAWSPVGQAWLEQYGFENVGDFASAVRAATHTEAAIKQAAAEFDRLDAEWSNVKASADRIVSDLASTPRKQLAALAPAKKARMMNELAAIDTSPGSDYRKAQYMLPKSMKLDPAFDEEYTKTSERVADTLAADDMLKYAKKNWAEWTKDASSREKNYSEKIGPLMKRIREIQSGASVSSRRKSRASTPRLEVRLSPSRTDIGSNRGFEHSGPTA